MIAFILWREFRLSIAELHNFFRNAEILFANKEIAIFDWIDREDVVKNFWKLGWSIKCVEIISEIKNSKYLLSDSIKIIEKNNQKVSGKFCFAIADYWLWQNIFTYWIQIKKELKKDWINNIRFVNKENNNINAAVFKKEKLVNEWIEINYIKIQEKVFIWKTIAYQDVDNYSRRDYWKSRDMQIWMLPPKLAQIMINLTWNETNQIYDPFCWLGTVLIEAINSWYQHIYWSDINPNMTKATGKNLSLYLDKNINCKIFEQDASRIWKLDFLKWNNISIVTEWYLGSIMTKWHVTLEKIQEERKEILSIYKWFFNDLSRMNYKWQIVISFPFWHLKWKYYYFEEIYELIRNSWFTAKKLLPENLEFKESKYWSLLYHRPSQQVWREIFCLFKK